MLKNQHIIKINSSQGITVGMTGLARGEGIRPTCIR